MLSRRRFLQLVASSIVALAARPKEVFASTGNIDGEQIQFTSEIAQELADKYIRDSSAIRIRLLTLFLL